MPTCPWPVAMNQARRPARRRGFSRTRLSGLGGVVRRSIGSEPRIQGGASTGWLSPGGRSRSPTEAGRERTRQLRAFGGERVRVGAPHVHDARGDRDAIRRLDLGFGTFWLLPGDAQRAASAPRRALRLRRRCLRRSARKSSRIPPDPAARPRRSHIPAMPRLRPTRAHPAAPTTGLRLAHRARRGREPMGLRDGEREPAPRQPRRPPTGENFSHARVALDYDDGRSRQA
jgi:hypothetical protein